MTTFRDLGCPCGCAETITLHVCGFCITGPCWGDLDHDGPHLDAFGSPWTSTGSPPSVTTRADNGTAWSAVIGSPDDAARWAGG